MWRAIHAHIGPIRPPPHSATVVVYRSARRNSLARLAGPSPGSRQVERGARSVDKFSVLVDIAQVLKTSVESLVGTRLEYAPNGDAPRSEGIQVAQRLLPLSIAPPSPPGP